MNYKKWIAMGLALAVSGLVQAQAFDSGSDGSFGAIELTYPEDCPDSPHEVWIDLPPDGVIHATTVTVESCVLRFRNNARNTPVYLLAQGDVVVKGGGLYGPPYGKIDVSGFTGTSLQGGLPGPGGFPGGRPYVVGEEPGPGAGPGGGGGGDRTYRSDSNGNQDYSEWPGRGVYSTAPLNSPLDLPNDGQPYGSQLLMPLMGGSGGGGSKHFSSGPYPPLHGGGSGGGGAILIASNTQILLGGVATWGEYGNYIPVILGKV